MAFTQAPVLSTYAQEEIPVVNDLNFRSRLSVGAANARIEEGMINMLPRKISPRSTTYFADTRPAVVSVANVATGIGTPIVRGFYAWEYSPGVTGMFCVVNQTVYANNGAGGGWVNVFTWANNVTSPVGFTEFIDGTNSKRLILVDGFEGLQFTFAGSVLTTTAIVDADFPTPHVPFPIFIDGYIFLAKKGTGDIYNCDLNNPTSWTAGNFISSELYPDDIQALAKVDNFMLAIGISGCEYFMDAANATGSPMQRHMGGVLAFGTDYPYTMATTNDMVMFLANGQDGEFSLRVVQGLTHQTIDVPWLSTYLNQQITSGTPSTIVNRMTAAFIRVGGDLCYVLRAPTATLGTDEGFFVYSLESKVWAEWTGNNYGSFPLYSFGIPSYSSPRVPGVGVSGTTVFQGYMEMNGEARDQIPSSTYSFPVETRTSRLNFGTLNRKAMHRLGLMVLNSNYNQTTNVLVYVCDDDATWVLVGTLDAKSGTDFPFLMQLGTFRQRAIKFVYTGTYALRFLQAHADINKGQQ
jgi:hypothetical protein